MKHLNRRIIEDKTYCWHDTDMKIILLNRHIQMSSVIAAKLNAHPTRKSWTGEAIDKILI